VHTTRVRHERFAENVIFPFTHSSVCVCVLVTVVSYGTPVDIITNYRLNNIMCTAYTGRGTRARSNMYLTITPANMRVVNPSSSEVIDKSVYVKEKTVRLLHRRINHHKSIVVSLTKLRHQHRRKYLRHNANRRA